MRHAVIDIGTNSVLMLIADVDADRGILAVLDIAEYTRLGEGLLHSGMISQAPLARTISSVNKNIALCRKHGADRIHVLGTEVFRRAVNLEEVLEAFHQQTGFAVEVLSGEQEAKISFDAVIPETNNADHMYLVSDIGGGSTEVIIGKHGVVIFSESNPLGAVHLKEKFTPGDPVKPNKLMAMKDFVKRKFESVKSNHRITSGIAIGGTATTVCAVHLKLDVYDERKVEGKKLTLEEVEQVLGLFCGITNEERTRLPGLEKNRADIIIPGTVILLEIMKHFALPSITVSAKGIRYGYLKKYLSD